MRRHVRVALSLVALTMASRTEAQWLDIFRTRGEVSETPSARLPGGVPCAQLSHAGPLELDDAILLAICTHPQARRAWAEARAQAAAVGVATAAYLPSLNATAGAQRNTLSTTYDYSAFGEGMVRQSQNTASRSGALELSWVLFDFGKRAAARRQALALLAAANANQDGTLQTVLFNTAQAFYALRDAEASLDAARRTEAIASESLTQTSAKHEAGAGTLADELQARTSYRRAVLDRVSAEGHVRAATGALAMAIGRGPNDAVQIAPREFDAMTSDDIVVGIDRLIDEAKRRQPKLIAARARLDAAHADVDAARAHGRPTLSLVGSLRQNHPSYAQSSPSAEMTRSRGSMVGVQLTIPLFEGFGAGYRTAQARAQADAQSAALHDTELQVSLDVWRSYHEVQTDSANLANSRDLLDDARRALDIARGRYNEGVGTFTELLTAQTSLADARKQRVLAVSRWQMARLRLAASLGNLKPEIPAPE